MGEPTVLVCKADPGDPDSVLAADPEAAKCGLYAPERRPDVSVADHGSILTFTPRTTAGRRWIDENVSSVIDETTWFGGGLVVEPRYAGDLARGMAQDGLVVA